MAKDLNLYSCLSYVFKGIPSNWECSFIFHSTHVDIEPDAEFDTWLLKESYLGTDKIKLLLIVLNSFNQGIEYGKALHSPMSQLQN